MSKLFEPSRTYKPFAYSKALDLAVDSEDMHWTEKELEMGDDVADWKLGRLSNIEKDFVTQILRMFIQSDVNVGEFYDDFLIPVFKNKEVRAMLKSFSNREETHKRAYALLNDTLGLPEGDYAAFLKYKEMADKDSFMMEADTTSKSGIAKALAKATFNEGVSLFASFAMLLNFQRRGLMKGMGKVVEWSIKDETKHVEGVSWLFRQLCNDHPRIVTDEMKLSIYQMARDCVALEDMFIDLAFAMGAIEGITPIEVKNYIRFIADRRLIMLGLKENWSIEKNPLPWIDILLNAPDHTNFFENKVAEYEVASLIGRWEYGGAEYRMYGRDECEYCEKAKALFETLSIPYEYVDLTNTESRHQFYVSRGFEGGQRTVPKMYKLVGDDEFFIGGHTQLVKYFEATVNETTTANT